MNIGFGLRFRSKWMSAHFAYVPRELSFRFLKEML